MRPSLLLCLLGACASFAGCTSRLDERDVREFIDTADAAARKRFAPEICELRGKEFTQHTKFHAVHADEPSEMSIDRRLYCVEAGKFSRIRQYKLERKSLEIQVASDSKTARVLANYIETAPYFEPDIIPVTPDDFREFQVLEVRDESVIGIESGDLVFLSTDAEIHQSLVPKASLKLPYD